MGGASGTPVTFSATGPATVSGQTLTINGAGTIIATANQAGTSNYSAAAPVQQTLLVNKAMTTLTGPGTLVLITNGQAGTIPMTITGQYSGPGIAIPGGSLTYSIVNSANVSVASGTVPAVAGEGTVPVSASLAPGAYSVNVSYGGDANYLASTTNTSISLQISQKQPVIQWATPTPITYGTTLAGLLNANAVVGPTVVDGNYAYATGTTALTTNTVLPVGTYTMKVNFTPTDTITYKSATGFVVLLVNKAFPGVSVSSSANPILVKNATTLTATVSSAVSMPTGTITFLDGTTPIGTSPLAGGVATLTTSSLPTGLHSIAAAYSGDHNFMATSSSMLTQHVDDFSLTAGSTTAITILPGGQATYQFTLSPLGDSTFPAVINLSGDGQPQAATLAINPGNVNAGSGSTNFSVTITTPSLTGAVRSTDSLGPRLAPLALAILLLPFSRRMRRTARKLGRVGHIALLLIVAGAALFGATGCGVKTGYFAQPQKTYNLTVTGTSGALSHAASVTLTVE